jgi:hypothetical protein
MTDRLKHGTKYPQVKTLPKGAQLLSSYKDVIGVKNAATVCVKYDRYLKGESKTNPGYKIVNFQGMNFAITL